MGRYIDGFVLPVPKKKIEDYRKIAEQAKAVWMDHGALDYVECIADDVMPGKLTSFPQSVMLEEDETVVFAWIVYRSREHRDEVNAAVFKDPRLKCDHATMPFDGKRMIYGGFNVLVEA